MTESGHVRFAHTEHPESAMTFYVNRRRRTPPVRSKLVETGYRTNHSSLFRYPEPARSEHAGQDTAAMADDDDLWPVLVDISTVTPSQATFQIHPTARNGGGLEIWSPIYEVSLASMYTDGWFKDVAADNGVAECRTESWWYSDPCEGRQLVDFDPALPAEAVVHMMRAHIHALSKFNWWQICLIVIAIGVYCICATCAEQS